MSGKNGQFFEFEHFRLNTENPGLWRGDELVALSPKALEILILLIEKHGDIVSREELLETVWRETFVEEANINYTISLLRKTLDSKNKSRFIQTVPKRGYRFIAEVREVSQNGESNGNKAVVGSNEIYIPNAPISDKPQKSPVRWHFIGIILLSLLFLSSFAVWWRVTDRTIPVAERNISTVAVLPFKNLNEDKRNNELSSGLPDLLISRLGSLNRFTIRPFDAVGKFEQSGKDALRFGEEIKVDAVLEGTFQTVDGRIRINVRLWDVRDGTQLWQETFDETETDIFILQDKLSASVARSLALELTGQSERLLTKRPTENADAFRAYLRGREIHDRRQPDWQEKATAEYQKAVELDPAFALAYTGFADIFTARANIVSGAAGAEFYEKARMHAEKAVALDAESAESHTALGAIKVNADWDWKAAERHFVRAVELNPNYARAHYRYAQLLSILGRNDEALAAVKKASEINPLSQAILTMHFPILEARGEMDEALKMAEDFYLFEKENAVAAIAYATFLYHKGDYAKVIELGTESLNKQRTTEKENSYAFKWYSLLSAAYHKSGKTAESAEMLARLEKLAQNDTKSLHTLAVNYAEMGLADKAFEALQKCLNEREERMIWLKTEPRLANLRNDPRFKDILRRMNIPE